MKLTLNTSIDGTKIVQELFDEGVTNDDPLGQVMKRVSVWVCETADERIKKALVEIGWTPPTMKCGCCEFWSKAVNKRPHPNSPVHTIGGLFKYCPECGRNLKETQNAR